MLLKQILKNSILYELVGNMRLIRWGIRGKPAPPPSRYKQLTIRSYAREFSLTTLIETGTCLGDTIYALRHDFDRIYSVELSSTLYESAKQRLSRFPNMHLLHGSSVDTLPEILTVEQEALFWLDAHYSGSGTALGEQETPIVEELEIILSRMSAKSVLLIDDAREFGKNASYPDIDTLTEKITNLRPKYVVEVEHDIIRVHPKRG